MTPTPASISSIDEVLATGSVHSVYQPIVDLATGSVVAYEALARGPQGPLHTPDALFAAARAAGRLAELDRLCRSAALSGAVAAELGPPLTVFVNVEPEVLESAPLEELLAIASSAPAGLRVVVEITERALATRPADLLRAVERVREVGWGIALDDVGAESMSLAFMPLLRPDVVKLDLRLVQQRPGPAVAEIMNAVNGYAERTGALVLAEGIEDEAHLATARALGAGLGQGWHFGRPAAAATTDRPVTTLPLRLPTVAGSEAGEAVSPFSCLPAGTELRVAPKALLIELSKHLERQAMRLGETCVVAATFQEARHFTPATSLRYRDLVARTGFVCALGADLPVEPVPGLRGAHLDPADPVRGEWDVVVLSPHFSAALLARDLGDGGPDAQRRYEYALTYERTTVERAGVALVSRVAAQVAPDDVPADAPADVPALASELAGPNPDEPLLLRALAATTSGVAIADMTAPDQPLIYVNAAFEQLAGMPAAQALGRNCRFLQSPDTDPATISRMRAAISAGAEFRTTLLNHRGPDREPWWNEIHLAPVTDATGAVVQYIGVQTDVTARVNAERELLQERDRTRQHLARIEQLAYTDPLTALPNRRRFEERMEAALWQARLDGTAVALLFLDLDGFKAVNDAFGHAVGDELLQTTADRLRGRLRRGDLLARLGGDEFLVGLVGLDPATAAQESAQVADDLRNALRQPVELAGTTVSVQVSIGVAVHPEDGAEFGQLLHHADARMYASKHPVTV